ncbi:type II restriction enzyme [Sedimentisphaera salicampi]|uniref:Uncharacterized protein n=1 Tax=Sedimentisphaera salicampi TaxID=1941349 RepID=A0A1W6LQF9_9BACT|nr:hypothetical protein [Sedimentisphaera salicampi]ARN57963.1 hypothetical protein STSP1_02389 [Sedimentisphaera salicampi]
MASSAAWNKIFEKYNIFSHDFDKSPFIINATEIKTACQDFTRTTDKEVRILCKQDSRELRPQCFKDLGLFLLPIKNGEYAIMKGEGYIDIPEISEEKNEYISKLDFKLESSLIGNSEMQHLDYAYACSLIRTFAEDDTLVLTIRGRKYTPRFTFRVNNKPIEVKGVQTEVDAGYEGQDQIVLIEAKNSRITNTIIRQLYYPFKKWTEETSKTVTTLFFEKENDEYKLWQFGFADKNDYNSIYLIKSRRYIIKDDL